MAPRSIPTRSSGRGSAGRDRTAPRQDVGLADQDQVVGTLLLVVIQPLAVVAAYALALDDLRPLDRPPLAGFLADAAGVALRPALDAEDGQIRQHAEEGTKRA